MIPAAPNRPAPLPPVLARGPAVCRTGVSTGNLRARAGDSATALVHARGMHTDASLAEVPDPPDARAAIDTLRTTAIRTLRQHIPAGRRCAFCGNAWPCNPAHLAATALGAG